MTNPFDFHGQTVLVTGGTRGLGLAIGLAFGARGARVVLTHRWNSADEGELARQFAEVGGVAPLIVEADAGDSADTERLLSFLRERRTHIDVFVSNVCVALPCPDPLTLRERDLRRTLDWSAWPVVAITRAITYYLGRAPTRVIATSSDGPDRCYPGYVPVALAKAALEALVATLSRSGQRAFVLRTRHLLTQSLEQMFPDEAGRLVGRLARYGVTPEQAGEAAVALASGLLDGLDGRVLTVDRGAPLLDHALHVIPLMMEGGA
ncbi:MAG: SDR family oxidoreductase [Deltaproteobacteria bacterium]|nr:SDR family oxidoreductase [Deltaproteobacteria bacterium]